jgi:hypothetical protein
MTGSSNSLFVDGNGNVGIGTTLPLSSLHTRANTNTTPGTIIDQIGTAAILDIRDSGFSKVIVDGNGNVGIGTTLPMAALDVAGTLKQTGVWFYAYHGVADGIGSWAGYTGFIPFGSTVSGSSNFTTSSATSGAYFTAPMKGIYQFNAIILNYPGSLTGFSGIKFSVNNDTADQNTGYGYRRVMNIQEQHSLTTSSSILLNKNDTVKIRVQYLNAYTQTFHATFNGYLVYAI